MSNPVEAIWSLLFQPGEAERYEQNPEEYVHETGLDQCDPEELHDLVVMAYERGPVNQGASVGTSQHVGGSSQSAGGGHSSPPPPPPLDPSLPPAQALAQTINYYVENTSVTNVDDRDTFTDSSVHTNVLAEEGSTVDVDVDNETNTASGDGAVAAGDDIEGVATGDGAVAAGDDIEGVATGDGAVAAGDDIEAPVNTGTNTGIIAEDSDIEGNALGDGNQVISDSTNRPPVAAR
jgi:hypothetical protein